MPGSNTDMRGVQSLLSGYHQKNITILDGISEKLVVTNLLRDIAIALAVDALLQSTDTRLPLRMSRKHLVTGRMGGHPVYVNGLDYREGRIILNILHDTFLYIIIHPEGEIVLAFLHTLPLRRYSARASDDCRKLRNWFPDAWHTLSVRSRFPRR